MPTPRSSRAFPRPLAIALALSLATTIVSAGHDSVARAKRPVIAAAGDIACAGSPCRSQRRTARLIQHIDPRAVLTLGDNQYPSGAYGHFLSSYDPTWGAFKSRTYPSPGNHEYQTRGAHGYFRYFGRRAHRRMDGRYSFRVARWHVVSLNSGRERISRKQLRWARRDLAADRHQCELVYWHHPRWSSTPGGSDAAMGRLWSVLFRAGVDVVLNGHEHNYERFALLDPTGSLAPRVGIREFVVGTGGHDTLDPLGSPITGSQKRIDHRHGVLRMTLHARSYSWRFISVTGRALDRGRQRCHR